MSAQISERDMGLGSEVIGRDVAPEGSEDEISLSIVKPAPKPAPVGVGGRKEGDDEPEAVDDTGALDTPPVPPSDES